MASQTLTVTQTAARVNLLPPEIAEQQKARKIQAGLVVALAAAAGVVGLLYVGAAGQVSDAQAEVDAAAQEKTRLTAERAELQSVADVYARVASREAVLRTALAQDIAWSSYLNDLMLTIPDNVWLTSMAASQTLTGAVAAPAGTVPGAPASLGTVTFSGKAFDHDDVATWLEVLSKQKGYANAYFSNSTEAALGTRKIYSFSSSVTITPDALSDRVKKLLGS